MSHPKKGKIDLSNLAYTLSQTAQRDCQIPQNHFERRARVLFNTFEGENQLLLYNCTLK